jgi:hypothetical protein
MAKSMKMEKKAGAKVLKRPTSRMVKKMVLSKKNVGKLGEMSREEQVQQIANLPDFASKREAIGNVKIPLEPTDLLKIFDNREMTKNYNRFAQTESKKDDDVSDAWKKVQESREPGKEAKKRTILLAWLADKCILTPKFKTTITTMTFAKTRTTTLKWITTHEILLKHGNEEGMQMIKDGSFVVRKNPANKKLFQFLLNEEFMQLDIKKQQELKTSGTQKISDSQYDALVKTIKGINVVDLDFDVEQDNELNEEDLAAFGEEEKKFSLPSCSKEPVPAGPKMTPEDKVLNFTDANAKSMPKVKYMFNVLIKDGQMLQANASLSYLSFNQSQNIVCLHLVLPQM